MKITKNRIKEIILEEMQYGEHLNESSDNIAAIIEQLVATQASLQSVADTIGAVVVSLENLSPADEEVDYNANPFDITKGRV